MLPRRRMLASLPSYIDLFFLALAWVLQWYSILKPIVLSLVAREGGPVVASVLQDESEGLRFWHIKVFSGLVGILVTNVLGTLYFWRADLPRVAALAALDLDTPFLIATQAEDYAKGRRRAH
ncbi:unnamed protein product [Prorocentrum cordatum]|uniref:Uncharacterized protein n=1 Tax=Prorocentrum cordatum TaxID=2364126 RepID=A0ABN9SCP7_9DINO|nr:unnamed protein product [Polarella glacialis]